MAISIRPRCALSVSRAQIQGRSGLRNVVRRFSSTQSLAANSLIPPALLASISSSKSIQSFLQSIDSLDPSSSVPEHTVSSAFVQKTDNEITTFLKVLARGNDNEWWEYYIDLCHSRGLGAFSRLHFSQILRAVHPSTFHLNTGSTTSHAFFGRLDRVKSDMTINQGYPLGLAEWNHLLDCARAENSPEKAHEYWNEMAESGVRPDTFSYNNLLAALCGKPNDLQHERPIRYRVDENGHLINIGKDPDYRPRNYQPYPSTGKSRLASDFVRGMVARNIRPNTFTYEILLIAFARDNDLDTCNDIIRRIWGFNPDGTPTQSSIFLPAGHPLAPSDHTLIAIANVYGYNGALAAAIALIEALSARYTIQVSISVWLALLLWSSRRSTLHSKYHYGFISPLAAPRLFQVMKSPPYNVNPGVEAYWHMVSHETKRKAPDSAERLLVDVIKRYGPNGTDLTRDTQHLAGRTLNGVKNWVPLLCDLWARMGYRDRAVGMFRRWQHRFHALETTGLLRIWDEVPVEQKTDVKGVFLPKSDDKSCRPTSLSIRRRLARASAPARRRGYKRISQRRREHYPARWRGPGRPLFMPFGINVQFGLGSPNPRFRKSYVLWQKQVQGSFARGGKEWNRAYGKEQAEKRKRATRRRGFHPEWEKAKRAMGLKSGYQHMRKQFGELKRRGVKFGDRRNQHWKRDSVERKQRQGKYVPSKVLGWLRKTQVTMTYQSASREPQEEEKVDAREFLTQEMKEAPQKKEWKTPLPTSSRMQKMQEKMRAFYPAYPARTPYTHYYDR